MKRLILLLALLAATAVFSQTIPPYVPTCQLRAWYPFTGNTIDSTMHGNNGTNFGAWLVPDRFGNPNHAYRFDGTSSYIYIPPATGPTSLDLAGSVSISAWVKSPNYGWGGQAQVFWRGDNAGAMDQYMLFTFSGSQIGMRRDVGAGFTTLQLGIPYSTIDSSWHHFVVTYDSASGMMCVYYDGALATSASMPGIGTYPTATFFNIVGAVNYLPSWQYFLGAIDDIGVWSRAITLCEVRELYLASVGTCTVSVHATHDTTVCASAAPITISGRPASTPYLWSTGAATSSILVGTGGTYIVTSSATGCNPVVDTYNVAFTPADTFHSLHDTTLCAAAGLLTLNGRTGYPSYLWSTGAGASSISVSTSGMYWVYSPNGCTSALDSFNVTIVPASSLHSHHDTSVCTSAGALTLYGRSGYSSYAWSTGSAAYSISVSSPGSYAVSSMGGACPAADTFNVTFVPDAVVSSHKDTAVCAADLPFTLHGRGGYLTYLWNTGATGFSENVAHAGTWWVHSFNGGCISMLDTFVIGITPVDTTHYKTDTAVCSTVGQLTLSAPAAYDAYLWSDGSTTQTLAVTATGAWSVIAQSHNCTVWQGVFRTTFTAPPTVSLGNDTTICSAIPVKLADKQPAGAQYLWSTGSTAPYIIVNAAGAYSLTVSLNGCTAASSVNVYEVDPPTVALGPDTTVCRGDIVLLQAHTTGKPWLTWSNGEHDSTVRVMDPGVYSISATNICGTVKDSRHVDFIACNISFPGAFTPNDDGKNDIIGAVGSLSRYTDYQLSIYNRFGQQVFQTNNITEGWNGIYNGAKQDIGTYFYVMQFSLEGKKGILKGDFQLIR